MKTILLSLFLAFLTNCSVMHFKNGTSNSPEPSKGQLHHNFVYGLIEGSLPVSLSNLCNSKWYSVTTQDTFLTGFLGMLDGVAASVVVPGLPIDIWDPQQIEYSCAQ
jgi:hypothetical protein